MTEEFITYKNSIHVQLHPIFQLLEHKREHLDTEQWIGFVAMTRESILKNPEQYFGREPSTNEMLPQAVNTIFTEVMEPQDAL
jgi:hypothetical protein